MQQKSIHDTCLAIIEGMNAGNAQSFDALWEIYDGLLTAWGEMLAKRVCTHAALTCKWRPSPAELREIAARLESPTPTADAALTEVQNLIRRFGANAMPHPENPRVLIMGEPPFSHPLVGAAVRRLGGWARICAGEAQYQEGGFDGAFRAVFDRAADDFREQVAVALQTGIRPAELFPCYVPFAEARVTAPMVQNVPRLPPAPAKPLTPMPAHVRQLLSRFGAKSESTALSSPVAYHAAESEAA